MCVCGRTFSGWYKEREREREAAEIIERQREIKRDDTWYPQRCVVYFACNFVEMRGQGDRERDGEAATPQPQPSLSL